MSLDEGRFTVGMAVFLQSTDADDHITIHSHETFGKAERVLRTLMEMWIRSISSLRSIAENHRLVSSNTATGSNLTNLWVI